MAGAFAAQFAKAARGNVAMIFALTLPVLLLITVGGVDIHRASTVRMNLQDALDAATLAAARSAFTDDDDLTLVGLNALRANLQAYPQITLREDQTTFTLSDESVVIANAKVDVTTLVANIFLPPYGQFFDDTLPVGAHSEVNRSSKNVEVGLVLDITGSMSGQKIIDLKAAADDLVDLVVQESQSPYYSRMAVVPYSIGVNLGAYANAGRGTPTGSRPITAASWSVGPQRNITGITRASPGVVTSSGHGFTTGDYVWIRSVSGMTQVNNRAFRVVRINNNSFSLQSWNGSSWAAVNTTSGNGYSSYSSGGNVRECQVSDCAVVVTANSHGIASGETVYITGVNGMTQINNLGFNVGNVTTNTYSIGVNGASWGTYSSGGLSWCGRYGCQWRVFTNAEGNLTSFQASTCATERTGAQAYTDASPATAKTGFNYVAATSACPAATIMPLNDDGDAIKTMINGLTVTGATAGQIGTGWGWYSVSPNFNSLWPSGAAGAYDTGTLLKAVILMTDGEFNTNYCSGVLAQNAGNGNNSEQINCDATNGDPFSQTESLCDGMKAQGIVVYTVGFQVSAGGNAADVLADCASSVQHAFLPASGEDLTEAFAAIGRDITQLRISK